MSRPRTPSSPRSPQGARPRQTADGDKTDHHPGRERRELPRAGRANGHAGGGLLWLWGSHPVLAALNNPNRRCRRLLLTAEAMHTHGEAIAAMAQNRTLPQPEVVERDELDSLLPEGAVNQGIALAAEPLPAADISDLIEAARGREAAVIICLDQVTDPHNVGAVLRSAAAFGALGLVVPDRHAPDETGTLAKSASGALEALPLVRVTNLVRALEELKQNGFWIAGLAGDAPVTLAAAKLSGRIVLVLGSEGEGLRRLTREHCDHLVKLPQSDLVESLNVSNAAAVALYELIRR
ncbi:23S rRNA (guanosine(2251)-2'-O)-methyltransferase RlmB [Telmatospirillum sp.]|uniref:23S rRNA (guanosine(2251)-2'-O)-methyltransferase RlmB n=1 Tax=Telmatospirillum sp. TaxID=2079197 RepID=UPI002850E7DB|nr:23S rRNA (guanosine(2251)-2'-O)-methyltransferase RlmB [Telmatospirillum sp.]MDR3439565.1 23S rRNA (guanosine(2251)-2'-O)-methyltransferase RlmB [Telmatospirillum sp.]